MDSLGQRLATLRKNRGLTQGQLAKRLSLAQSTIASWETDARDPNHEMIANLADFFDATTDYLLGKTDTPRGPRGSSTTNTPNQDRGAQFITRARETLSPEAYKELLDWSENMREILEKKYGDRSKNE